MRSLPQSGGLTLASLVAYAAVAALIAAISMLNERKARSFIRVSSQYRAVAGVALTSRLRIV